MEKVSLRDKAKKSSLNSRACKTCKFKYTCVLDHHLYPCLNAYENGFIKDKFNDEIYLVIRKEGKQSIITGCAHRGIINILNGISNKTGSKSFGSVIGGIHTKGNGELRALRTAEEFLKIGADKYYLNHCTGIEEYTVIKGILKEKADYFFTGRKIEI